jgi:hypothetical protein
LAVTRFKVKRMHAGFQAKSRDRDLGQRVVVSWSRPHLDALPRTGRLQTSRQ